MTQETMYTLLRNAGTVVLIIAAVIGLASVIMHSRVAWRATEMGRHLMAYMLVIDAVIWLSLVRVFLGDNIWFAVARLIVFSWVPIVMGQRLWLQIQAYREK